MQDTNLTMVVLVLFDGGLIVRKGFIHLVAGIDNGLNVVEFHVFLSQLGYFEVCLQFPLLEDGLCQLPDGIEKETSWIHDGTAAIVCPAN